MRFMIHILCAVLLITSAACRAQEWPPLKMGWIPVARQTHAVEPGMSCGFERCELPGDIYEHNVKLALHGNPEAAYEVGLAYLQGYGVQQDLARAERWFLIGAQTPYDKQWLAEQYRWGRYFPKNLEKVDYWYCAAGDHYSLHELALVYRMGTLGAPDPAKAVALDLELLKGGDGYARLAAFELGNMVIDGQYSSHDTGQDLKWAREITQELIGQEEYKLAWTSGSGMDLAATPEVKAAVVRSAASFGVDLAQAAMSEVFPATGSVESYAWLRIAGRNQQAARVEADRIAGAMTAEQRVAGEAAVKALDATRLRAGASYRDDDPLLAPDFDELKRSLAKYSDPEKQLRLAYHDEVDIGGENGFAEALALYKVVRDQRVASVRLRIGNEYLLGTNGFPHDAERAAKWYGFAAKAGSTEACTRLAEMKVQGC